MKRHPKSVENFCYIIENQIPISNDEQQILYGLINLGFNFDDINSKESIEFLKKIFNEKIIFDTFREKCVENNFFIKILATILL